VRSTGDVDLGVNSLLGGALYAQADPSTDKLRDSQIEWTPPRISWHEGLGDGFMSTGHLPNLHFASGQNTDRWYLPIKLRHKGIPYDGSDLILQLKWDLDFDAPGGGDDVDFRLRWAFLKADGTENASTAVDDSVLTTIDVSARTAERLYKDNLPDDGVTTKIAGVVGAKILNLELVRFGADDNYGDSVAIYGMRLVKV